MFYIVKDLGSNLHYYHLYPTCPKLERRPVKAIPESGKLRLCKYCQAAADAAARLNATKAPPTGGAPER